MTVSTTQTVNKIIVQQQPATQVIVRPQSVSHVVKSLKAPVLSVHGRIGHVVSANGDYDKVEVGLPNVDNTSDMDKPVSTAQQAEIDLHQDLVEKAQANGYCDLDQFGLVPVDRLPITNLEIIGPWSAATNTPTLADGVGTVNDAYWCIEAGTVDFGSGPKTFALDDYAVYTKGDTWEVMPNLAPVDSVHGRVGDVVAVREDYEAFYVDNTGDTMTGNLALPGDPTLALEAAPKQYVDQWRLKITDVKTAAYTAQVGEYVRVDGSGGAFAVTAPLSPVVNDVFAVKVVAAGLVTVEAPSIESRVSSIITTQIPMWAPGEIITWRWSGAAWLIESWAGQEKWAEAWLATPITAIGTPSIVQWTFEPLFTGQQQRMFSESAGVFTYLPADSIPIDISLGVEMAFTSITNNVDATFTVDIDEVVATSPIRFLRIRNSFQSSRSGNFPVSGYSQGAVDPTSGDTYQVEANLDASANMDVDLDAGLLIFETE